MILKITVHDNDYQTLLTRFCENIAITSLPPAPEPDKNDPDYPHLAVQYMRQYIEDEEFLQNTLKKTYEESTKEERKRVIELITNAFKNYMRRHSQNTADYLTKRFRCQYVPSVTDQWNNGEDFYLFPTSYEGKILCF